MEAWRLKMEPLRIRIRIEVKSWIRISIGIELKGWIRIR
jgi:hypothetical protein